MVVQTRRQKKSEAAVAHPIDKKGSPLKSTSKKAETKALSEKIKGIQAAASDNPKLAQKLKAQINVGGGKARGGIADPMVIDAAENAPEGGAQEPTGAVSKAGAASKADSSNNEQNSHQEGQNDGDNRNTPLSKPTSSQGSSESNSSVRETEPTGSASSRSASAESTGSASSGSASSGSASSGSASTGSTGSAPATDATSPASRKSSKAKFNGPKRNSNAPVSTADEDPEDVVIPQVLSNMGGGELEGYISMGFQKWLIFGHGPPQARLYDHEIVKSNENWAPDLRATRLANARGTKKILALQGVVWAGGPHDFERLKPPTLPGKRGTAPLIKCKWNYNGEIHKS